MNQINKKINKMTQTTHVDIYTGIMLLIGFMAIVYLGIRLGLHKHARKAIHR